VHARATQPPRLPRADGSHRQQSIESQFPALYARAPSVL
jgi:hypothetical protein